MLRLSFLLMLILALLAGQALAAHSASAGPGCGHDTVQSASGSDCGNGDGMAAGACSLHCGSVWSVPAAIPAVHATAADALPFAPAASAVRCLAGPPDPAPPKA